MTRSAQEAPRAPPRRGARGRSRGRCPVPRPSRSLRLPRSRTGWPPPAACAAARLMLDRHSVEELPPPAVARPALSHAGNVRTAHSHVRSGPDGVVSTRNGAGSARRHVRGRTRGRPPATGRVCRRAPDRPPRDGHSGGGVAPANAQARRPTPRLEIRDGRAFASGQGASASGGGPSEARRGAGGARGRARCFRGGRLARSNSSRTRERPIVSVGNDQLTTHDRSIR